MWTHDPKHLQTAIEKALAPMAADVDLRFRPMFGGIMAYAQGRPFASLSNAGLAVKLAGEERDALLAMAGAAPLRYEPDSPPSKSYTLVPPDLHDDPEALRPILMQSITYCASLPPKKPKKKRTAR